MRFRVAAGVLTALVLAAFTSAQPLTRRATTVEAIRAYPGFFHSQAVVVLGSVAVRGAELILSSDAGSLRLVGRERPSEGPAELRGIVYDIGRLNRDDPRLLTLDIGQFLEQAYGDRWPRPGEELVLHVSSAGKPPATASSMSPPLRQVALAPDRYAGEKVTIVGQFRGRNLFADVPDAPTSERDDFVLRSGDGALWVTGLRARGKDFSFETTRRVDTGRWLRVAGTVRAGRGLVWLQGASVELAEAPTEEPEVEVPPPPPPPLEIVFSSPTSGETDVSLDSSIRLQLSRDLDAATLKDRIRLTYSGIDSQERGEPQPPAIEFKVIWTAVNRGLEIKPVQPLERFRQVRLELLDGIRGPDGAALKPFTLSFSTVGS
jgi:Bacterial Ig-like domain